MTENRHRRYIIAIAKLVLAVILLAYLVYQAKRHESFTRLVEQPKRWSLLIGAVGLMVIAAMFTIIRWFLLVRALKLPFKFGDAMRLGTLGYVLNLVSLGAVGGDLFKALLIAKDQPGRRTEAVATVVIDRLLGLYALLLVAAGAVLLAGVRARGGAIAALADAAVVCTVMATIGLAVLCVPAITGPRTELMLARVRLVGGTLARLLAALRVYRGRPAVVIAAVILSGGVHVTLVLVVLCIAHGLPGVVPEVAEHFVLVPLSMVAGAVPLTPNGLGTFEAGMEFLYQLLGTYRGVQEGTGTIVALGYRLVTFAVAGLAAAYYVAVSGHWPSWGGLGLRGPKRPDAVL